MSVYICLCVCMSGKKYLYSPQPTSVSHFVLVPHGPHSPSLASPPSLSSPPKSPKSLQLSQFVTVYRIVLGYIIQFTQQSCVRFYSLYSSPRVVYTVNTVVLGQSIQFIQLSWCSLYSSPGVVYTTYRVVLGQLQSYTVTLEQFIQFIQLVLWQFIQFVQQSWSS